jgi:hypothetical protein
MLHSRFERKRIFIVAALLAACVIVAVALSPAVSGEIRLLQSLGMISCTAPSPGACQTYSDTKSGAGLIGVSTSGKGLIGQTKFNSTSTSNGQAGVLGQDLSTSGNHDAGVKGTSTRGAGVSGTSTSGSGISGISTSGAGVVAQSTNAQGLLAKSINSNGIDASTSSPTALGGRSAVFGHDDSNDSGHLNKGLAGFSVFGIGVLGTSFNWVGVNAVGGFHNFSTGDTVPALSVVGNGADLIDACPPSTANPCDFSHAVFAVEGNGIVDAFSPGIGSLGDIQTNSNFIINGSGQYIKGTTCVAGCSAATATSTGRAVTTYASMVSQPTVEDFGEAQLVNGQTYVHLDPKFANVVDQRANYLVFITPEGDANVLYVTQKSASGFAVRESHAGRSTLMFSYRIVAKPFGSHEARLPMVGVPRLRHPGLPTHIRPLHV